MTTLQETSKCSKCKIVKVLSDFPKDKTKKLGIDNWCKQCNKEYQSQGEVKQKALQWARNNYHQNKEKFAEEYLIKKYGLTREEYFIIHSKQQGLCAVCNKEESAKGSGGRVKYLAVDHCHTTGKIRGLLCHRCNVAIGMFGDSIKILNNAITYLEEN